VTGVRPDASEIDVVGVVRSLANGAATATGLARTFLERIEELDPAIRAWVHVDAETVLARAGELDGAGRSVGALHGVPLGVKDIFDTHDMPTAYGSPIYAGHRPATDAACVALARSHGMLPLGKCVTTEFAAWPPGPTVNPHDVTRTPGGSSSGSAAAVAAGMVPVAFATQTTGSIIRPAAFCGVVGYKPTHGTLPCVGVKAISESFDTVGVIARSVADAALVVGTLSGRELGPQPVTAPRLAICRTPEWPAARPETEALFDELPAVLERAGARVTERELPDMLGGLAAAQGTVWTFEIARCLADEHLRAREAIREPLRGMLDDGRRMPIAEYEEALRHVHACRAAVPSGFEGVDALVVPAAPGEAPDAATTGDPIFNRAWSALGGPALTVPAGAGPAGLPLGLQVVGPPGDDRRALSCAAWLERALADAAGGSPRTPRLR
jgi:amidase